MSCKKVAGTTGTLEVLSGAQGWMTISPSTMSKKKPLNKHIGYYEKQAL